MIFQKTNDFLYYFMLNGSVVIFHKNQSLFVVVFQSEKTGY